MLQEPWPCLTGKGRAGGQNTQGESELSLCKYHSLPLHAVGTITLQDIRQFKHQMLTQTQMMITREFSQLNIAEPHLRNIQMLALAV